MEGTDLSSDDGVWGKINTTFNNYILILCNLHKCNTTYPSYGIISPQSTFRSLHLKASVYCIPVA